jgi:DNA-directed RNA polymerase subunit RPC12/RpoP
VQQQTAPKTLSMICPNLKCRKVLRVPEQYRGEHVRCHYCSITFLVPPKGENRPLSPHER